MPYDVTDWDIGASATKIDRIYHLAGAPRPSQYKEEPVRTIMTSVLGTYKVLELAKQTGARVLFTSSADADYCFSPTDPRSAYIDGKKVAEDLCFQYAKDGVDVRIARLFSTYGPGMKKTDGRVIPAFIRAAEKGEKLMIYGQGHQIDSFCYIDDAIKGLYALMEHPTNPGEPVDLGNPNLGPSQGLISIEELARKIIAVTKSSSTIDFCPAKPPRKTRVPDIYWMRHTAGWNPMVGLQYGLEQTAKSFREVK